jgi:MSHA biogenesis protein MshL
MTKRVFIALSFLLGSCAAPTHGPFNVDNGIADELNRAFDIKRTPADALRVQEALLPPLSIEIPAVPGQPIEPRFDLAVSGAPAKQVFMSIVSGTRYSMLVHPEVAGAISVNLKDVSVQEALQSIREIYGYEYRVDGTRIYVQPAGIQTRVFRVNYLIGQRTGRSDIRVTSGSVTDTPSTGLPGVPGAAAPGAVAGPGVISGALDSSRIQTQTLSDFWEELRRTLQTIVGAADGRNVIVNPQAGVVVVRAMPTELRNVEAYLKAIRASVERQVMLEAKIIEVTLSEQFQAGVNWALFSTNRKAGGGQLNPNTTLGTTGVLSTPSGPTLSPGALTSDLSNAALATTGTGTLLSGTPGGSLLGLAFQTQNFAALLQFLETQGLVQVLSSPRIATMNNQKAVLKVGTDEFFITNITGGSTTSGVVSGATTTFPTLTLRPFFSGVALDVTPQIDEGSNIILHIHPSVSEVQQDNRQINLGTTFGGNVTLPLARSTVSETDSIVKVVDGNIVAIGGLMKVDVDDERSGIPGAQDIPAAGALFRSRSRTSVKKELVILIKPTVIQGDYDSNGDLRQARERIMNFGPPVAAEKN